MSKLNILVAEDKKNWQSALESILKGLGNEVTVEIAPDYPTALRQIKNVKYDLVTIDLKLPSAYPVSDNTDLSGMELMRELHTGSHNQGCGLIVLTAYPTLARTKEAFLKYGAFDFIEKQDFDNREFLDKARAAILDARLKYAVTRMQKRFKFTITFNDESLLGGKMTGPSRGTEYVARNPKRLDVSDLIRRADSLNLHLLNGDVERWRREAKSIGNAIYKTLADDQHILQDLRMAQVLPEQAKDFWLEFSGPATVLGIPFELLREGEDYLCLRHTLTRRLAQEGVISRNPDPFHTFIQRLQQNGETFRLLIVGSNSDGSIPGAEDEARELARIIDSDLQTLGIPHEITSLIGEDATYNNVRHALSRGGYHVFHYAGHGRYMDTLPEISELILLDNGAPKVLSAADLNLIVQDSDLQFVFLSCCVGARSAVQLGRGAFFGPIEALTRASILIEELTRAEIPSVLIYRWTVADTSALLLAESFYESLWHTFSPGQALLEARLNVATMAQPDDYHWASPVLVTQND